MMIMKKMKILLVIAVLSSTFVYGNNFLNAQSGQSGNVSIGIMSSYATNSTYTYLPYRMPLPLNAQPLQADKFKICDGINFSAYSIIDLNRSLAFLFEYSFFPFSPAPENYATNITEDMRVSYKYASSGFFSSFSFSTLFNIIGKEGDSNTAIYIGVGLGRASARYKLESTGTQTGYSDTYESFKFYFKPKYGAHFLFLLKQRVTNSISIILRAKSSAYSFKTRKIAGTIKRVKDDYIAFDIDDYYDIFPDDPIKGIEELKEIGAHFISYTLGIGINF